MNIMYYKKMIKCYAFEKYRRFQNRKKSIYMYILYSHRVRKNNVNYDKNADFWRAFGWNHYREVIIHS